MTEMQHKDNERELGDNAEISPSEGLLLAQRSRVNVVNGTKISLMLSLQRSLSSPVQNEFSDF